MISRTNKDKRNKYGSTCSNRVKKKQMSVIARVSAELAKRDCISKDSGQKHVPEATVCRVVAFKPNLGTLAGCCEQHSSAISAATRTRTLDKLECKS